MTDSAPPSPAKVRRTQLERRQTTQQKLIDSAIELLKQKRYAGFRTADVATLAQVSRGAQTHHFPQKDELVIKALEEIYRITSQRAFDRIRAVRRPKAQLLDALMRDAESFFLGEDFLLSLDLLMVGGDEFLGREVKRLAQQYRPSVEQAWKDAFIQAGFEQRNAEDVVEMTFCIARGLGVRELIDRDRSRARRLAPRWREMAVEMLGAPRHTVVPPPKVRRNTSTTTGDT